VAQAPIASDMVQVESVARAPAVVEPTPVVAEPAERRKPAAPASEPVVLPADLVMIETRSTAATVVAPAVEAAPVRRRAPRPVVPAAVVEADSLVQIETRK
jgi:hypothetical protein